MNAERAIEIRNSELWNDINIELGDLIDIEMAKLRRCLPEDVIRIQTRIDTFEFIRSLPQNIIDRES